VRGLWHVFRSLKHHVLEEMRKACAAFALIARTDVVIDRNRHHRNGSVFIQNHSQTVIENELFDGGGWNLESFLHVLSDLNRAARSA
jgi:hypothetical protein